MRKNRTLIEAAITIPDEYKTPDSFWAEAINTACHAINHLFLHKYLGKTPYEIDKGKGGRHPPMLGKTKLAMKAG